MSPRSASHRPRHDWRALRDVSPTQGWISDPHLPSSAPHGSHCLSRDFTQSAKPALEKQTSQVSPAMHQCMDSAWVWLLAGPIKCNWPSVTLWSVFQYPVTYIANAYEFHNHYNYLQSTDRNFWQVYHSSTTLSKLSCIQYTQAKSAHFPCLECNVLLTISIAMLNSNSVNW